MKVGLVVKLRDSSRLRWALAVVGGAGFALCAPPTDVLPAVLGGLACLHAATVDAPRGRVAFARALLWATSAGIVGLRFVPDVIDRFTPLGHAGGVLALVLVALAQGVPWGLGALAAHAVKRDTGLDEHIAFAAGVLLAISLPGVFVWTPAGLMSPWPVLLQLAEVAGERGVSFLLAVASALLVHPLLPLRRAAAWHAPALGAGVLAALVGYGALRMPEVRAEREGLPRLRVGLVQGAVEARLRWERGARDTILRRLRALTRESEKRGAELTVWPEAAYPYVLQHGEVRTPRNRRGIVVQGVRGPVLVGLLTRAPDGRGRHNSAVVVGQDGFTGVPQAKLQLLWFGETVPLVGWVPAVRQTFYRASGLVAGSDVELQSAGAARIGVLNCYEDTLPGIGRRIAEPGPNLLANVTNDAWFAGTIEPELHLRLSVARAVEARRDLVRAVNLGAPAWIDSTGTVRARGSESEPDVLLVEPVLNDTSPTIYTTVGDVPVWILIGAMGALSWLRRERYARDA